ncbi:glycoside hydrolase family 3 C-terminal domain-containing protein [Actinokineospora sp. UTMC 2448]|uniref:glycoside hydrolase family 3 C-terminal domain-containing protein n=1 Tax=Actinokineospora sp. UTMC 2448 TaxID=2268449 RepID=UPI0021643E5B|nr:glycoside hydrolase family 3 C-terminal domain-containing protein [Actinokineospora sp. UTMC 2448]UVS80525.1 Exo-alpha-(1->6)-L-arabinopyranosidase [Actinokineospora sp. UTMC 2448]
MPDQKDRSIPIELKASLTSGSGTWHSTGAPGLVRPFLLADGPHGVRRQRTGGDALGIGDSVPATCFPPGVALGSTWDPELVRRVGAALGQEAAALEVDVLLGPGMNIKRSPLGGRNFEYLSEDPHLTGRLAAAYVEGVQSSGVGACVKHFAVNNQETDRMRVSAEVDQRALREIYLRAFEHVVKAARPAMVMSAYNRINGVPASEDHWLLTRLLREEWGFDGVVVSDWGAVDDRVAALRAGLDLEMPPTGTDGEVVAAVDRGELDESALDAVVDRLRRLEARLGGAKEPASEPELAAIRDRNADLAREAAAQAAVLLTNDGVLPLDRSSLDSVAVIGEFARTPRFQGGGSSRIVPTGVSSALDALTRRLGADVVRFAPGYSVDGSGDDALALAAVEVARAAHVAVVFLGLPEHAESEGFDRTTLDLPADQVSLLERVAAVAPRVVVVLSNGGVVSVAEWRHHANAILEGWLLGQAGGEATADLLLGDRAPSGRLAETIPLRLADHPSYPTFPGADGISVYGESVHVGYRYFDTVDRPVAFPFGHGLTYTRFEYSDLRVVAPAENSWEVTFSVTNTGDRDGREVAQLYVGPAEDQPTRPRAELRGFVALDLRPGETTTVTLPLTATDLQTWDARGQRWTVRPGDYAVHVGASSRDVRLRTTVHSDGDRVLAPLTAQSTIAEWRADPAGRQVLATLLDRVSRSGLASSVAPELVRMFLSIPLDKLRSFGLGVTSATVAELVREADARQAELLAAGAYRRPGAARTHSQETP